MKLIRILAMPFTVVADVASLGNMGGRSFTQQLFDADRHERETKEIIDALKALAAQEEAKQ